MPIKRFVLTNYYVKNKRIPPNGICMDIDYVINTETVIKLMNALYVVK